VASESPVPAPDPTIVSILDGSADPVLRLFAARDLLPLGIEDRLRVLLATRSDRDPEVAAAAVNSSSAVKSEEWLAFLDLAAPDADEIAALSEVVSDPIVLEKIVRDRRTPDEVLLQLARAAESSVLDALAVNQRRLLACPELIDAAFSNPSLSTDARRLLTELREEFFEKEQRRRAAEEEAAARRALAEVAEAPSPEDRGVASADGTPAEETPEPAEAEEGDSPEAVQRRMAINQRLAYMTVSERIDRALKGTREERRVLISDVSKPVWEAVLKCPSLTEFELQSFASTRNVDEGVFRQMVLKPDWMRKYGVVLALVRNPAVPLELTAGLVKFLRIRDLKLTMNDRNLSEGVRVAARKLYLIRRQ
jgi:hypothetical protein